VHCFDLGKRPRAISRPRTKRLSTEVATELAPLTGTAVTLGADAAMRLRSRCAQFRVSLVSAASSARFNINQSPGWRPLVISRFTFFFDRTCTLTRHESTQARLAVASIRHTPDCGSLSEYVPPPKGARGLPDVSASASFFSLLRVSLLFSISQPGML
jgi:hypothetical protein